MGKKQSETKDKLQEELVKLIEEACREVLAKHIKEGKGK